MPLPTPPSADLLSPRDRRTLARRWRAARAIDALAQQRPGWLVEPHDRGQVQALASGHTYRILIPGNGFGKTTCMAMDADMLMQREDPFKPHVLPSPDRPTTAIWVTMKLAQWEIMRPDIEALLTRGWKWRAQKNYYEWPNASRLFVVSADSDWAAIQGIEIDAVYFDEHPPKGIFTEMQYRRRGKKRTRFFVAATMTQGITWFVKSMIQPWEEFNRRLGRTNEQGLELQDHGRIFLWNTGGLEDNPSMTDEDAEHYRSVMTASEKERHVRLRGGYADFTGEAVFHMPALIEMERRADESGEGADGALVFLPDHDPEASGPPPGSGVVHGADGRPLAHRFAGCLDQRFFEWREDLPVEGGRITIYEPPDPDQRENYVIGADFAAGLVGKDYDAAIVGRKTADGRIVQVAEATGHWGSIFFAETLYALGVWYFEAFIVGERQFGLPALRRLYDEMGYTFMLHQRREEHRARRHSDLLGHHRSAGDTIIPNLRLAVKRRDIQLASPDAITQLKRYQFKPRNKTDVIDEVETSAYLTTGAPSGEHDDLVMAAAYMLHGALEIMHYTKPRRAYRSGSFGDVMNLDATLNPTRRRRDPYSID